MPSSCAAGARSCASLAVDRDRCAFRPASWSVRRPGGRRSVAGRPRCTALRWPVASRGASPMCGVGGIRQASSREPGARAAPWRGWRVLRERACVRRAVRWSPRAPGGLPGMVTHRRWYGRSTDAGAERCRLDSCLAPAGVGVHGRSRALRACGSKANVAVLRRPLRAARSDVGAILSRGYWERRPPGQLGEHVEAPACGNAGWIRATARRSGPWYD